MDLKLTGWNAIVAIVALVGFLAYSSIPATLPLDGDAADRIRLELRSEFVRGNIDDMKSAIAEGDNEKLQENVDKVVKSAITFKSLKSKGWGDDVVVRAEILVNGLPPFTGEPVRYYKFNHGPLIGWNLRYEVSWLSYYLKLW